MPRGRVVGTVFVEDLEGHAATGDEIAGFPHVGKAAAADPFDQFVTTAEPLFPRTKRALDDELRTQAANAVLKNGAIVQQAIKKVVIDVAAPFEQIDGGVGLLDKGRPRAREFGGEAGLKRLNEAAQLEDLEALNQKGAERLVGCHLRARVSAAIDDHQSVTGAAMPLSADTSYSASDARHPHMRAAW